MIKLPQLADNNFQNKTVLVRCDFDVPLKMADGIMAVAEEARIKSALPTIEFLLTQGAKVVLLGHLGRPAGQIKEEFKLKPVAEKLKNLLGSKIPDFKPRIQLKVQNFPVYLLADNLWLLENLRFDPGEEENDILFAKKIANLGDFYVNEAFAASHREHASIVGLPALLAHAAGFNFISEVENLSRVFKKPGRPLVFLIGGAKPETKLPLVEKFAQKADWVLVGGLLPKSKNFSVLSSNYKNIVGGNLTKDNLDIDETSVEKFKKIILSAGMIVWNGPLGKFEVRQGEKATKTIAQVISQSRGFKLVGGGETIAALNRYQLLSKMDFISLGGGAMLEFLAKETLPGIEALWLKSR